SLQCCCTVQLRPLPQLRCRASPSLIKFSSVLFSPNRSVPRARQSALLFPSSSHLLLFSFCHRQKIHHLYKSSLSSSITLMTSSFDMRSLFDSSSIGLMNCS